MGMQIPCGFYPEISAQEVVWPAEETTWHSVSGIGTEEGKRSAGGPLDGGSRSHVDIDTTEMVGVTSDGLH